MGLVGVDHPTKGGIMQAYVDAVAAVAERLGGDKWRYQQPWGHRFYRRAPLGTNETAERIIADYVEWSGVMIQEGDGGENGSYYSPRFDQVTLPPAEYFVNSDQRYRILFHELAHSTQMRLDRISSQRWITEDERVVEELTAAFTEAILCRAAGLTDDLLEDVAAYVDNWMMGCQEPELQLKLAMAQAVLAAMMILGEGTVREDNDWS
jgi:antirestriction protein ArdC